MTDDRIEQPAPNSVPSEEAAAPAQERSEAVTEAAARDDTDDTTPDAPGSASSGAGDADLADGASGAAGESSATDLAEAEIAEVSDLADVSEVFEDLAGTEVPDTSDLADTEVVEVSGLADADLVVELAEADVVDAGLAEAEVVEVPDTSDLADVEVAEVSVGSDLADADLVVELAEAANPSDLAEVSEVAEVSEGSEVSEDLAGTEVPDTSDLADVEVAEVSDGSDLADSDLVVELAEADVVEADVVEAEVVNTEQAEAELGEFATTVAADPQPATDFPEVSTAQSDPEPALLDEISASGTTAAHELAGDPETQAEPDAVTPEPDAATETGADAPDVPDGPEARNSDEAPTATETAATESGATLPTPSEDPPAESRVDEPAPSEPGATEISTTEPPVEATPGIPVPRPQPLPGRPGTSGRPGSNRPGSGRPGSGRPGSGSPTRPPANPSAGSAAAVPTVVEPTIEPVDPHLWGRIDDAGVVYVRTASGERVIGNWQAGDVDAGLAHFGDPVRRLRDRDRAAGSAPRHRVRVTRGRPRRRPPACGNRSTRWPPSAISTAPRPGWRPSSAPPTPPSPVPPLARAKARADASRPRKRSASRPRNSPSPPSGSRPGTGSRRSSTNGASIKGIDRKTDDALWKRFARARDTFTRNRGSHFAELDKQRGAAREVKESLIKRAEELSSSSEWGETAAAYRELMAEWKAAGRAPREVEDELWERFRAAQEKFFARRNQTFADRDAEYETNAAAKEKLLAEAKTDRPGPRPRRREVRDALDPGALGGDRKGSAGTDPGTGRPAARPSRIGCGRLQRPNGGAPTRPTAARVEQFRIRAHSPSATRPPGPVRRVTSAARPRPRSRPRPGSSGSRPPGARYSADGVDTSRAG